MKVRKLLFEDLDWAVDRLAQRRASLVPYAPVYWRPAADAARIHRRYLGCILSKGGAVGIRTDDAFLIAAPGRDDRWTIDDAVVPDGKWAGAGELLWDALSREIPGSPVRFVCPVPEPDRADFAKAQGLHLEISWWHETVEPNQPPCGGHNPHVVGATASLVAAPRIYDPGGPILFLTEISNFAQALTAARAEAKRLGSPVVVADQPHRDTVLAGALQHADYYRHRDFFDGAV